MKRHGFDTRNPDFIWNKNRLVLEKEAIKRQMLNVIKKKPANKTDQPDGTNNWLCFSISEFKIQIWSIIKFI